MRIVLTVLLLSSAIFGQVPEPVKAPASELTGEWNTFLEVGTLAIPYKLRLAVVGKEAISGSLESSNEPGANAAKFEGGRLLGDAVSFNIQTSNGPVSFEGVIRAGWLTGRYGGRETLLPWIAFRRLTDAGQPGWSSQGPAFLEGEWEGTYGAFNLQNSGIGQGLAKLSNQHPRELGTPMVAAFVREGTGFKGRSAFGPQKDLSKGADFGAIVFGPESRVEITISQATGSLRGTLSGNNMISGYQTTPAGEIIARFRLEKRR